MSFVPLSPAMHYVHKLKNLIVSRLAIARHQSSLRGAASVFMLTTRTGMLATAMHGWRAVAARQMRQRSAVAMLVFGRYLRGSYLGWLEVARHERQLRGEAGQKLGAADWQGILGGEMPVSNIRRRVDGGGEGGGALVCSRPKAMESKSFFFLFVSSGIV